MIKAVFFDIDNTLFHYTKADKAAMKKIGEYGKERLNIEPAILEKTIAQAMKNMGERVGFDYPSIHNRQIRFQNTLEMLHLPSYPYATEMYRIYWDTHLEAMAPEPGIISILELLKKKNIYIGIGSDMTSYIQNKKLERLGAAQYFDGFVTSEEAGCDKPDPQIFKLCAEKAGCQPEECLFIGDNKEKDVMGPRNIGMWSALYRKYSKDVGVDETWCIDSYEDCIFGEEIRIGDICI